MLSLTLAAQQLIHVREAQKTAQNKIDNNNNNNSNNNNHLTAVCPGQPGLAGTIRNIYPLTPILVNALPLSPFSICNGPWHPLYLAYVLDSPLEQPLSSRDR